MSRFITGNLLLLLSMLCAASSQLLLKALVDELGPGRLRWQTVQPLLTANGILRGALVIAGVGGGFVFWVLCLTKLTLSYAYPVACSSVLLVTLFSVVFLEERVTTQIWIGTILVVSGVALLTSAR